MNIALASLLVMMLAGGWVLIAYFQNRFSSWDPRLADQDDQPVLSPPALILLIVIMGYSLRAHLFAADAPPEFSVSQMQLVVLNGALNTLLILGALMITPRLSLKNYGFHAKALHKQLLFGILGFLASLLPVFLLLVATNVFRSSDKLHPYIQELQNSPSGETIFWIGIAVTISAPLMEELMYRVILQTALSHWLPIWLALPLTAVIFCAMHGWPDMIPLLPLALILGWIYHRHRSYLAIVTTHALFNGWMLAWTVLNPPPPPS